MKRIWALLMVLSILLAFCSCGPGKKITSEPGSQESETTVTYSDETVDVTSGGTGASVNTTAAVGSNTGKTTKGANSAKPATTTTKKYSFDITKAPMPTANLSNKTITYYSWVPFDQSFGKDPKSIPNLFKKEFGATFKGTFGNHETYWDQLATLKAGGNSPDMVMLPNWNFYPIAITEKCK